MSRADVEADITETLGLVPEFFAEVPDPLLETEWMSFKNLVFAETAIPRLFGATEEEINEAALIAKNTMGWSTYLNTRQFDYDSFTAVNEPAPTEFDQIAAHVRAQMAAV
jgi:hypothetical protein